MHGPCIFLYKTKKKLKTKRLKESHNEAWKFTPHFKLHVLGTMMMAINRSCRDYTLISLKKMMIGNHVNMVPNAWLTRK